MAKKQQPTTVKITKEQGYIIALLLILLLVFVSTYANLQTLTKDAAAGAFFGAWCIDSDGLNYFTKGYVLFNGAIYYDSCASSTTVKEGYCDSLNRYAAISYTCPYGCSNGACLTQPSYASASCKGTHTSCSYYTDSSYCGLHKCTWANGVNATAPSKYYCIGTPHACSSFTTQSDCQNNHGCTWGL